MRRHFAVCAVIGAIAAGMATAKPQPAENSIFVGRDRAHEPLKENDY
jgi:hypothetical protein